MDKQLVKTKSQKPVRKLEILLALSATAFYALCLGNLAFGREGMPGPAPSVVSAIAPLSPLKPESRNGDYLNEVEGEQQADFGYNPYIFEKSVADEMASKFKSYNEGFEARAAYQLNNHGDYLRHEQSSRELAEWTLKKLLQWHLDHTIKDNLEKQAKETAKRPGANNGDRAAAQTVMALSSVSKAIRGTSMNFSANTKARLKYDLPSGALILGLTSPIADATIDWRSRVGTRQLGASSDPEKMSVKVSRRFHDLGASTGVQYGLVSQQLNYGIHKSLVGPLSAGVDQAHNLHDTSKDETVLRLNLGTNF